MAEQARIELASWDRFYSRNLLVAPGLLGESMTFPFDGHEVEVSLPSAEGLPEDPERGNLYSPDERLAVVSYRRVEGGKPEILTVAVEDVDVAVFIPGESSVPRRALEVPPTRVEFFSEQQRERMEHLASRYGGLALRAFDLWIRSVRWKADDHRIGLPEVNGIETGWATYLTERRSRKRVWSNGHHTVVPGQKVVDAGVWSELPGALSSGGPPVYVDLLHDASAHLERGDLQRALVDTAVSAETFLRTSVQESLPGGLSDELKRYVNEAHIRRVLGKFFPERLDEQQRKAYKAISSNLHKLFNDRNDILHSGRKGNLTPEYCRRLIDSARALQDLLPRAA